MDIPNEHRDSGAGAPATAEPLPTGSGAGSPRNEAAAAKDRAGSGRKRRRKKGKAVEGPRRLSAKQRHRRIEKVLTPFRITRGRGFKLSKISPRDTGGLKSKKDAKEYLKRGVEWLAELQDKLYAQDRYGVLLIFQAMDAAGKDGAIKHVLSGVNPQGCQVFSFKGPSAEDLDHDFLWRTNRCLPERGRIGIFNRSYYEEVLAVRVHPEYLAKQKLPKTVVSKRIWKERFEDIRALERYLARQGYLILKFFLHVSANEQKRRFLSRLDLPEKNWKFSVSDAQVREHFKAYMKAYEETIRETAAPHAPWYVIPADNKWFTRLAVAAAIYQSLEGLDLAYPEVSDAQKKVLQTARVLLEGGGKKKTKKKTKSGKKK